MVSRSQQTVVIEEDAALGEDPRGYVAKLGHLHVRTIHEDLWTRLEAEFLLTKEAFNYAEQKFTEVFGFDFNLEDVSSQILERDKSPRLNAMLQMLKLRKQFTHLSRLYKWLMYLRNLTTRRLVADSEMRTYFGKIVGYKSIPPFDEYETMRQGDREALVAALISEIETLYGIFNRVILAMFKRMRSWEDEVGFNAAYLAATNPERFAEIQEQMEE